jgi:hypothetical protein
MSSQGWSLFRHMEIGRREALALFYYYCCYFSLFFLLMLSLLYDIRVYQV